MVTYDEVFALAVELGVSSDFLPRPDETDLEAMFESLLREKESQREFQAAAAPVFRDLHSAGIGIRELTDIRFLDLPEAVPIIIKWFPQARNDLLIWEMIAILGDRRYFPQSKQALIDQFYRIDPRDDPGENSIRFRIAGALARNAKAADVDLLMALAGEPRNQSARTLPTQALGRFKAKREKTVPLLMRLLDDDSDRVWAYAAMALGLLRVTEAREKIAARLKAEDHPDWIIDLKKALKRIDEGSSPHL